MCFLILGAMIFLDFNLKSFNEIGGIFGKRGRGQGNVVEGKERR